MKDRVISAVVAAIVAFLVSVGGGFISQHQAEDIAHKIIPASAPAK